MSDPKHLLAELALGALTPEDAADAQAFLAEHPDAREEYAALREAVTDIAVSLDPVAPSAEARTRLLAALDEGGRFADFAGAFAKLFDVASARAHELLDLIDRASSWEPGPGLSRLVHFDGGPAVAAADNGFVRVPPNTEFPAHEHLGEETVLVLQGSATDSAGHSYRRGDVFVKAAGTQHSFRTGPGADFIFAVTVGGVNFAIPGGDPDFEL